MAQLALNIRNYLAQQEDLRALLGSSKTWDTWMWADKPLGKIEGSGKINGARSALLVVSEGTQWTTPNEHNTLHFPRIFIDVWADPTRNQDGDVAMQDADNKISAIHRVVSKYLHLVDNGDRKGQPVCWGTAAQMESFKGSLINSSTRAGEPAYADVRDGDGARMAAVTYNVSYF